MEPLDVLLHNSCARVVLLLLVLISDGARSRTSEDFTQRDQTVIKTVVSGRKEEVHSQSESKEKVGKLG